ncbi:MAG: hypothetical protein WBE38_15435, partial [Terracidiphilus sp.]
MSEVSGRSVTATVGCALRRSFIFAILLLVSLGSRAIAQPNAQPDANTASPLATLRPGHPRLIILDSDMPAIKRAVAGDPFIKAWYRQQLGIGEKLLSTPPDVYVIGGDEHTLLATSRDMEGRIFTLAGLYRINGDKRFAGRATQEMLAAAAF